MEVVLKISASVKFLTERNMLFRCCTQLQLTLIKWHTHVKSLCVCSSKIPEAHKYQKRRISRPKTWLVTPAAAYRQLQTYDCCHNHDYKKSKADAPFKGNQSCISRPHTKSQHQTRLLEPLYAAHRCLQNNLLLSHKSMED